MMYKLKTTKQLKDFDEVIRLHYEEGYGEDRIASILPVGHTTVSRWIAIFASQQGEVPRRNEKVEPMESKPYPVSMFNPSQLISVFRLSKSQPKSGNDRNPHRKSASLTIFNGGGGIG